MRHVVGLMLLLSAPTPAFAEIVVASLSSHRVMINSNYTGTSLAVFGAIESDARSASRDTDHDAVVTVRGPDQSLVIREKERLGPFWLNRGQQKFSSAPAYLAVLASRSIEAITVAQLRQRQKIGLAAVIYSDDFSNDRGSEDQLFREALYRLKAQDGLYLENDRGVTFLTPRIFRAMIPLPATAPPGRYDVVVTVLAGGVVLASTSSHFELAKTGFEEQVGEAARDWRFTYGSLTAFIAIFFGWVANVIFRHD
jgi:uncharacterized protein (TIGR02186 family)